MYVIVWGTKLFVKRCNLNRSRYFQLQHPPFSLHVPIFMPSHFRVPQFDGHGLFLLQDPGDEFEEDDIVSHLQQVELSRQDILFAYVH
jgi:hypothetical protein